MFRIHKIREEIYFLGIVTKMLTFYTRQLLE